MCPTDPHSLSARTRPRSRSRPISLAADECLATPAPAGERLWLDLFELRHSNPRKMYITAANRGERIDPRAVARPQACHEGSDRTPQLVVLPGTPRANDAVRCTFTKFSWAVARSERVAMSSSMSRKTDCSMGLRLRNDNGPFTNAHHSPPRHPLHDAPGGEVWLVMSQAVPWQQQKNTRRRRARRASLGACQTVCRLSYFSAVSARCRSCHEPPGPGVADAVTRPLSHADMNSVCVSLPSLLVSAALKSVTTP